MTTVSQVTGEPRSEPCSHMARLSPSPAVGSLDICGQVTGARRRFWPDSGGSGGF